MMNDDDFKRIALKAARKAHELAEMLRILSENRAASEEARHEILGRMFEIESLDLDGKFERVLDKQV